ncbi:MAG TPA: SIS domain-containing protein [Methylomirabilota bacterium]|jgi:D-sedoheptulose 7-phosphate isomerase|nr:SIS domain-containing protein [Methylomirabilota bacterium]
MKDAILRKARESAEVKEVFFRAEADRIEALARVMAAAFERGGRLWVMGNGGGATDAQHVAVEFCHPILAKRRPLPAIALTTDPALLTAIANDRDFARVFGDQLRTHARRGDMALALSTSGQSPNLVHALEVADELGLLTIAFTGKDGGRLADLAEHAFVVPSFSIHRIQETHVALYHVLWDLVHLALGEEDVV